jgi:hypothetical protein
MAKYEVNFFTADDGYIVFTLNIDGGTRTTLLNNILLQEWEQSGSFNVDGEDWEDIVWNFLQYIFKDPPYPYGDDGKLSYEYKKFLYNLEMLAEYNLSIRGVLEESSSEIQEEEILNIFCESIVENFDYVQSTFNPDETQEFTFDIEKV